MYKIIKKTAVILSLFLTSVSIRAMDPQNVAMPSGSNAMFKKANSFDFLEGNNPIKLFQDIVCLTEAKRDYHLNMAQLCSEIEELGDHEKGIYLLQMYG